MGHIRDKTRGDGRRERCLDLDSEYWHSLSVTGAGSKTFVAVHDLCPHCQYMLGHDEYMTVFLQRTRVCSLRIRKLFQRHDGKRMEREVLLNDEYGRTHVLAKLIVNLIPFGPAERRRLIESESAFGNVLSELGVEPYFSNRRYFLLSPRVDIQCEPFYGCDRGQCGRTHLITDGNETVLASVMEILT